MAKNEFEIDRTEFDKMMEAVVEYEGNAEKVINSVIQSNETFETFTESIIPRINPSGRSWKKKKTSATETQPFKQLNEKALQTTVKTETAYNYLYFPDDGSNTERHYGNQQFLLKGVEAETSTIIENILEELGGLL